ncbi:MAG: PEP/pyruvate-binding domain-containing protein [Acidimicrobiales bacterium]
MRRVPRVDAPLPLWLPLAGRGATAQAVGAKAAALDRLVGHGIPVPRAAALTTEAYVRFVETAGLVPAGSEADDLTAAFLSAPLPDAVREAIHSAFAYASVEGAVAVRSSATAEDLPTASFAGQYRSVLGVDEESLEEAVRCCWASLWSPAARAYRGAQHVGSEVAMGVVVQAMVDAEHSGVVFTADPTSADPRRMRVEVVEGLGEGLVSGAVTPEVFGFERPAWPERRRRPAWPERRHWRYPAVVEPGAPPFLSLLGRLALEIERREGGPQDIEWSVKAGRVYILQARPITSLAPRPGDGFDTPAIPGATFTPAGVAEMLPGVLPPLLWTCNAPMLEDAFVSLFRRLRIRLDGPGQPMVGRFRGRAALNLTLLKAAAQQMPRGSAAEVERQYLGRVVSGEGDEGKTTVRQRLRRARSAFMALRLQRRLPLDAEVFLEAVDVALDLQPDLTGATIPALVAYRRRLRELANRGMRVEIGVAASAAANYRGLEVVLERWLSPDEAPLAAQRLTSGSAREQAGGCGVVLGLWDVHCEHCQDPDVARAVYEGPVEGIPARLRAAGPPGVAFLQTVEDGLRRAGCAAVYAGAAWEEDPGSLWSLLRQCRGADDSPTVVTAKAASSAEAYRRELEHRLCRSWKWRTTRVLTGQIVDVRRRLFRRTIADTGTFLSVRERVKSAILRLGGEDRRVVRELTRRLVAVGTLHAEGDEWFLADGELESLALGKGGPRRETLERRRAASEEARQAPPLPELVTELSLLEVEPPSSTGAAVLQGWATSPGRVTGRALVVGGVAEARNVTRADILVGHSTDPSWTPLILTAAGIVMEQGGPLSHAAIVAREFGVPAVLNLRGATTRIRTGMLITVDGTKGTVEVVQEGVGEAA